MAYSGSDSSSPLYLPDEKKTSDGIIHLVGRNILVGFEAREVPNLVNENVPHAGCRDS